MQSLFLSSLSFTAGGRRKERREKEKLRFCCFPPSVAGTLSAQQQSRKCKDSRLKKRACRHGGPLLRKLPLKKRLSRAPFSAHFLPDRPADLASKSSPSLRPENLLPGSALLLRGRGVERVWPSERQSACLNICGRVNYIVWPQTDGADVHFSPSSYCCTLLLTFP